MILSLHEVAPDSQPDIVIATDLLNDGLYKKLQNDDRVWGTEKFTPKEVADISRSSFLLLAKAGSVAVGAVSVTYEDVRIWGEDGNDNGSSLYIHKLVTSQAHRSQSIGSRIITDLENTDYAKDRKLIKLNFPTDNTGLRSYYNNLGFSEVREIVVISELGGFECMTTLAQREIPSL